MARPHVEDGHAVFEVILKEMGALLDKGHVPYLPVFLMYLIPVSKEFRPLTRYFSHVPPLRVLSPSLPHSLSIV